MSARWTAEQVAMLRALYPDHRTSVIATRLGRPFGAVKDKAFALGLRKLEPHPRPPERPSAALRAEIEAAKAEWGEAAPYEGWRKSVSE